MLQTLRRCIVCCLFLILLGHLYVHVKRYRISLTSYSEENVTADAVPVTFSDTETCNFPSCRRIYVDVNSEDGWINRDFATSNPFDLKPWPFLHNFRNPCWLEEYDKNISLVYEPLNRKKYFYDPGQSSKKWLETQVSNGSNLKRLRCFPYVYIIGQEKCGTTDLWNKMSRMRGVAGGGTRRSTPSKQYNSKEVEFWDRIRFFGPTLSEYINYFDESSLRIINFTSVDRLLSYSYHSKIILDGSPTYIWDMHALRYHYFNNESYPKLLTPDYIHHLTPNIRLIVALRDPIERTYTDAIYWKVIKNATQFHDLATNGIKWMQNCFSTRKDASMYCMYSKAPSVHYVDNILGYWKIVDRIRMSLYWPLLRPWVKVFGKDKIHIHRLEDYATNKTQVLQSISNFLDFGELDKKYKDYLSSDIGARKINNNDKNKDVIGEMLPETKDLLKQFFYPFNKELALEFSDDKLTWAGQKDV